MTLPQGPTHGPFLLSAVTPKNWYNKIGMALKTYQKKRKFKKTPEPKGRVRKRKKGKLIYVIQKHHASHLHWDLRLEWQGVLKSWAVPKEPSALGIKRLAVRVEDHPVEYAKFYGKIPAGQYGAGTVEIWDRGTWQPEEITPKRIIANIKGKKLKGRFALIKFKPPKNWLFFKMSEN